MTTRSATDSPGRRPDPGRLRRAVPPLSVSVVALALVFAVLAALVVWRSAPRGSVPGSPRSAQVTALLGRAVVVPTRTRVPGYQRDCTGTSACVFGPAWSDATSAPDSGNGCSTRDDVLRRDLRDVVLVPGQPCRVRGGTLLDPYTGKAVDAAAIGVRHVHVDHVFPLSAAWDLGAARWPPELRARFANDTRLNLLAAGEAVNEDKGDKTPGDWMPPEPRWRCHYAGRYLAVAVSYGLAVTEKDRETLAEAARRCPA